MVPTRGATTFNKQKRITKCTNGKTSLIVPWFLKRNKYLGQNYNTKRIKDQGRGGSINKIIKITLIQ